MRRILPLLAALAALIAADAAAAFSRWNDVRTSAPLPGGLVTIRAENDHGAGITNTILYADGGIQEVAFPAVPDGPSTLEATVPGPTSAPRHYGFRTVDDGAMDLLPVRLDAGPPSPADLTLLADDPVGDELTGRPHLDLVACRLGRDDTRLYAALTNDGGGFPVSAGLTFFSYLLAIKDPADADPDTLFGMIQTVTAGGIIEPGLYQINGTGTDDLVKIGEITVTEFPADDTLVLSCLLADLEANAVFKSWYDAADPIVDVAAFTQRITLLGGTLETDSTPGAAWHLREVAVAPGPNTPPQLSGLAVPGGGAGGFASVSYDDAEGHCPVQAEIVFDGTDAYPLRPQTLDYGATVEYRSEVDIPPLVSGAFTSVVVRFSDNAVDVVELSGAVSSVAPRDPLLRLRAAPNPFTTRSDLRLELGRAQHVEVAVYDLAGRRVRTLARGTRAAGPHVLRWDGRDANGRRLPVGVYIFRVHSEAGVAVRKIALLR